MRSAVSSGASTLSRRTALNLYAEAMSVIEIGVASMRGGYKVDYMGRFGLKLAENVRRAMKRELDQAKRPGKRR